MALRVLWDLIPTMEQRMASTPRFLVLTTPLQPTSRGRLEEV